MSSGFTPCGLRAIHIACWSAPGWCASSLGGPPPGRGFTAAPPNAPDPRHTALMHADATAKVFWDFRIDWVITNPPFNLAQPMLEHAVRKARVGVAFLLRKTFLEP